ncbi:hypothetical protein [Rhodovulum adriaticum]|uniref:hypothetical protein n=1 Tax=Rhodovulum adriaticum TaxID=35804 RepID=UPI00104E9880|nr:hypothetical protein [Rhodovulum adriaticum]
MAAANPDNSCYSNSHIWLGIEKLVKAKGCKLSLYADDITISGDIVPKALIWDIKINATSTEWKRSVREWHAVRSQLAIMFEDRFPMA